MGAVLVLALVAALFGSSLLREEPLRVVIVGDSVSYDAEPGIRAALEATGDVLVETRSIGGVGLLRPGIDGYLAESLEDEPDVVVVMLGGWDLGEILEDPSAYEQRLDEVAELLTSSGANIVWLGMPPTPPGEGIENARQAANRLFAGLGDRHPSVVYIPTGPVIGGPTGGSEPGFVRFRAGIDGTWIQVRKVREGRDDGHLCPGGAVLLGSVVLDAVSKRFGLGTPADLWWEGSWTSDPRYDDPPGSCSATA
ncbi:MAG TPA: hypothetical protein DGF10_03865 [Acidimicrobiaceae bacterium]|nr:hypothetical protein [Acidimicrobiaceae bacterium]HAQ22278.1 hypothetical protein [Acidimicrobiaceae bacterium]HCV33780.1 hypothetical protein [Acidimicrobiaceae bacterium]|tara:strand:+ start:460 stop:1218 length:759 start_codon:yes stop_codon:yes gene_type:complete